MTIELFRKWKTAYETIGELHIDGAFFCFTLEDATREEKIKHETAIPAGTYEIITDYSVRFKKVMPLLLNVPGYEGVRIHGGNTKDDTSGCILLGTTKGDGFIGGSRRAMKQFLPRLQAGLKEGKVRLEISEWGSDQYGVA